MDQNKIANLITDLSSLAKTRAEQELVANSLRALDGKYALSQKMAQEPGVEGIIKQLVGRIYRAYRGFDGLSDQRILDIACGSNSSKAPADFLVKTPFGEGQNPQSQAEGFTALFEPWFCRMLLELGADPVGIDMGNLAGEAFEYYHVDLGQPGALDFLPDYSFDAVQDSRLFGSPEFTAQFPDPADRRAVAEELRKQERRLLKAGGSVIHSDAAVLLR
jgi:hypothetical protein